MSDLNRVRGRFYGREISTLWDGRWHVTPGDDANSWRPYLKMAAMRAGLVTFAMTSVLALLAIQSPHAGATIVRSAASQYSSSACPAGAAAVTMSDFHVDASKNLASATFSVVSGCPATEISLASYKAPSATFSLPQTLFQSSTNTFTAGASYTMSVDVPSCYYQVDLVVGGVISDFSTGLYGARKIASLNGGTTSCDSSPPPPQCASTASAVTDAGLSIANGVATGTFRIAPGCINIEVSLASYATASATFSLPQTLYKSATGNFSAGGPYSLSVEVPSCFYQVDLVRGPVITDLTPNNLYGSRLLAVSNGGTACTTTTPPPVTPPSNQPPSTQAPPTVQPTVAPQTADVAITKQADSRVVSLGSIFTYTLDVTNAGPAAAADVTVAENLPSQVSLISAIPTVGTCTGTGPVICSLGNLSPGDSVSIKVKVRGTSTGTAVNTATVSTTSPESSTANNQARATVQINGVFTPPTLCASLSVTHAKLHAARETILIAHVYGKGGKPMAGVKVVAKGPGVLVSAKTSKNGVVKLRFRPHAAGTVQVSLVQSSACALKSSVLQVAPGAFTPPPTPTFTG
jgi:uncharacterized repeat protein (TIGR01451 family)